MDAHWLQPLALCLHVADVLLLHRQSFTITGKGSLMEQLILAREAAERIGVSVATVKAWMRRGSNPLPSVQVGNSGVHRRVVASQITTWLEAEAARNGSVK